MLMALVSHRVLAEFVTGFGDWMEDADEVFREARSGAQVKRALDTIRAEWQLGVHSSIARAVDAARTRDARVEALGRHNSALERVVQGKPLEPALDQKHQRLVRVIGRACAHHVPHLKGAEAASELARRLGFFNTVHMFEDPAETEARIVALE